MIVFFSTLTLRENALINLLTVDYILSRALEPTLVFMSVC